MKFNFLFSQRKKPEYFLVLDIGTETVKTLIFRKENNKNIIVGRILEYFAPTEVFGDFDFQEEILQKTISKAINEVQTIAKVKIKNLFLGLPANILRGRIIWQNFQRKNPKETINDIEERKIYEEVFNQIKIKLSQEFAQKTGLLPHDFYFSNLKILKTKIDGYKVLSIRNLNGRNLEFNVLAVFISKYQLEKIKKICQNLNLKILKIVHLAENLPYIFSDEKINAIFIDIGGKLTNIFLVEKGELVGISEFNKGGADFTQRVSQNLGLFFPEARILKEDYSKLLLTEEINQRIKEIFSDSLQNWFENLKEKFKKFPHKLLPSNLFLFGGGSLLPEIPEILEKGNFANLTFISQPKVGLIYPESLKDIEDKTHILNTPQDIPLLLIYYE